MKRAAVDHPKLQRLQRRLSLSRFQAMGLMEALWHFTGRYAPQGDLGRWSDEEIAAWIEWTDDPAELIETLVACGWLDRDPKHRLLVHDWAEHADEATKVSLKRAGKTFVVATDTASVETCPAPVETCRDSVATLSSPPEPEPEPEPCQRPETLLAETAPEPEGRPPVAAECAIPNGAESVRPERPKCRAPTDWGVHWQAFLAAYPPRNGDRKAAKAQEQYKRLLTTGIPPEVLLAGVERYRAWTVATQNSGTPYVKQITTWLNDRSWEEPWDVQQAVARRPNGPGPPGPRRGPDWNDGHETLEQKRDRLLAQMREMPRGTR